MNECSGGILTPWWELGQHYYFILPYIHTAQGVSHSNSLYSPTVKHTLAKELH